MDFGLTWTPLPGLLALLRAFSSPPHDLSHGSLQKHVEAHCSWSPPAFFLSFSRPPFSLGNGLRGCDHASFTQMPPAQVSQVPGPYTILSG